MQQFDGVIMNFANKPKTTLRQRLAARTLGTALLSVATPVALLAPNAVYAAPASEAAAVKSLSQQLSGIKSMTANFVQTTSGATRAQKNALNSSKRFTGTMQVQRPNKFRWHTQGNAEQLIVANGNTLWIYDKDLSQATRQSVNNQVGDTPALLLSGDPSRIGASFRVTQPDARKAYYVLYPKTANANFRSLALAFNGGVPTTMVLNDNLGQVTRIDFSGIKRNPAIAASQFVFTPPKGVDVITQ
ncbi:outer membrane lipoprotein chaperone LolA [Moraxella atlantae]|uniref:Outer-membrane lipoprotein carrier protein n=1 Tax=Faucicola atlantae TaxID=34059 RepID=A0A378Q3U0_9GAMM|nr:outer membrane lipoprotein chaperone LolA [Moraxella atlantae]OPH34614.1 outer membrane lipoprotein carrier protein LolA [Moraxella atlantae]STY94858.1 Outer-membrane lipoprotein carrier protein precursor [Moraxella atlantae]